jgi:hypothetical protein
MKARRGRPGEASLRRRRKRRGKGSLGRAARIFSAKSCRTPPPCSPAGAENSRRI